MLFQVLDQTEQLDLCARLQLGAIHLEQHVFQRDHEAAVCPLGTQLLQQLVLGALLDCLGFRYRRFLLSDIGEVVDFLIVHPLPLPLLGLNQCLFRFAQRFWRKFCYSLIVARFLHGCLRPCYFRIGPLAHPASPTLARVPIAPAQQRTQLSIAVSLSSPMFIALAEATALPR